MYGVSLSDFYQMPVVRTAGIIAEIMFEPDLKLIGFSTDSCKSDLEVREEAYKYWLDLNAEILNIKNNDKSWQLNQRDPSL